MTVEELHIGVGRGGPTEHEKGCPCPKAACGLVISSKANCPVHSLDDRLRTMHPGSRCPGATG